VVLAVGWAGFQYGVPVAARHIAERLPSDTLDRVSAELLANLDRHRFAPSGLPRERQQELQARFAESMDLYPDLRLRVLFRRGGDVIGANAFALPDGTMIFTDEIVQLAERDEELLAVLAHEVGHIAERHSLRSVVQGALLGFAYLLITGDSSASADVLLGLPMLMATLSYSRKHEREADAFSAAVLDKQGIDRQAFVDLMHRLANSHRCDQLIAEAELEEEVTTDSQRLELCERLQAESTDRPERSRWGDYLSTHPGMHQRLQDFLERY
jgi:Zn-dependent protease with chaperone function